LCPKSTSRQFSRQNRRSAPSPTTKLHAKFWRESAGTDVGSLSVTATMVGCAPLDVEAIAMDFEQAKKFVDKMEADYEQWVQKMGGREMIAWIVAEQRRRRELREARLEGRDTKALEVPTPAPVASSSDASPANLVRRIEVLEAQVQHLTRRLERKRLI
jgi:hypothetical protein